MCTSQDLTEYTEPRRPPRRKWPEPRSRIRWAGNPRHGAPKREYSRMELTEARLDRLEATLAARGIDPVEP